MPSIDDDGWCLISAVDRHKAAPKSFEIPSEAERSQLQPGSGAQLLFDIETRENGAVIDRGVDRMWVIVRYVLDAGYVGVLDSDPGKAENLRLRPGDSIEFAAEHVCKIDSPPRAFVLEKYGSDFFD